MEYAIQLVTEKTKNQNFDIYWDAGNNKLDDYYMKYHTEKHHKDTKTICTRQIKFHAITIYEPHDVMHTSRACWDKTVCPAYDDVITTRCR